MVRVRFAPSPTGFLHLGGVRTALFNYLFAAGNNGKLILRIEDTDQTRTVPGSVDYLQNAFKWLGIQFNEGPHLGGPHSPYIQSERLSIYRQYAQDLVKMGGAYPCFCSKERLQSLRVDHTHKGRKGYDRLCRELSLQEVEKKIQMGVPHVLRLKIPSSGSTVVKDVVYGNVEFKNEDIDDQVLVKADGYPTYHFANVIDDKLMEISHVIRGEEWLSSACKHQLLYEAFDWSIPVFVHVPLLRSKSGSKLSKRHKEVHVENYKEKGYTPEGLINFVAFLGWSPKTEEEIFTLEELIQTFSLEGINKAAPVVDNTKLDWLNSVHARRLFKDTHQMNRFVNELRSELLSKELVFGLQHNDPLLKATYLSKIINLIQDRTCLIPNIPDQASYFWNEPEPNATKLISFPNADTVFKQLLDAINDDSEFTKESLENKFKTFESINIRSLLRQCVTGGLPGPDIIETSVLIGKERIIKRLKKGHKLLL